MFSLLRRYAYFGQFSRFHNAFALIFNRNIDIAVNVVDRQELGTVKEKPSIYFPGVPPPGGLSRAIPATSSLLNMPPKSKVAEKVISLPASLPAGCGAIKLPDGKYLFRVWAPHASAMELVLFAAAPGKPDATSSRVAMDQEPGYRHGGHWMVVMDGISVGDKYCYALQHNGAEFLRRDPYARFTDYDSTVCFVTDTSYNWQPYSAPPWEKMIIYQLHVGSFTGRNDPDVPKEEAGTFAAIEKKLDYLKEQGFNAIQMLPVHEYSGSWGYNPRQFLSIMQRYGTPEQLRHLVDTCHQKGIAVIFDLVLNHCAPTLNSLWNFDGWGPNNNGGIYFEGSKDTTWGRNLCFHKDEVRDMLLETCFVFLREYNADGLRLDSVHSMPWQLLQQISRECKSKFPGKLLIAEITPETPDVIHGAGFDSTWIHSTYFDTVKYMKGKRDLMMVQYMVGFHKGFTQNTQMLKYFLGSHDQVGCRKNGGFDPDINGLHRYAIDLLGGLGNWHARAQVRMWYSVMGISAGIPMMYMGSEMLQNEWWHIDPQHHVNWAMRADERGKQMLALVRSMNSVRVASSALTSGGISFVQQDDVNGVLVVKRKSADQTMVAVINAGEGQWDRPEYGINVGEGREYRQVFNSQDAAFGGWETSGNAKPLAVDNGKIRIVLPKWAVLLFECTAK
eukprot:jgi/Mesvir1/18472/Mv14322-RA.1